MKVVDCSGTGEMIFFVAVQGAFESYKIKKGEGEDLGVADLTGRRRKVAVSRGNGSHRQAWVGERTADRETGREKQWVRCPR